MGIVLVGSDSVAANTGEGRIVKREEDASLQTLVTLHGKSKWARIAKEKEGRTRSDVEGVLTVQCFNSSVSHEDWSPEEDGRLMEFGQPINYFLP